MHYRSTKEEICCLVELELSPEEEWTELYREWKQAELQDLWLELKRVEQTYLRRLHNRKRYVEETLGIRVKARVPKQVITPPVSLVELVDQAA